MNSTQQKKSNRRTVFLLGGIVAGMFAFGFALVPLYQVFCNITGFNGSSQGRQAITEYTGEIDRERLITVQFDSTINAGLPWDFAPQTRSMQVHPGEIYEVAYVARNNADESIVAQAVPGVTPWQATPHFTKMECFCFDNQTLQAGEQKEMPLRFVVSPGLPQDIKTLTLSYTFMNTNRDALRQGGEPLQIFPATSAADSPGETNPLALTMHTTTGGQQE